MSPSRRPRPAVDEASLLAKATVQACRDLGLPQKDLAAVLGISEASASRLARGRPIDPQSKPGELALVFLRLYRSLDALVGGDTEAARKWLHAPNRHLGGVPASLIRSVTGLVDVTGYLDAMRGTI